MGLCATQIVGLPISAEYTVIVGGASVVRQDFERGSLIWDERQAEPWKCYFSAVGKQAQEGQQEVATLRQQVEQANHQSAALQQQLQAAAQKQPTPTATSDEVARAVVALLAQSLMSAPANISVK